MLILTRKVGESLVIGDDVVVTLLSIKGNQVRLGIKAPQNVSVHREEIYHRICDTLKQFGGDVGAMPKEAVDVSVVVTKEVVDV